jgi:YqaJ-like viral recombinase domain
MLAASTKTAAAARAKYICEKLTDAMPNDEFEQEAEDKARLYLDRDPWIRRGNALEPVARQWLAKKLDREIVETGLILHDSEAFGASPDGLIVGLDGNEWEAGCEIKAHNRKRHLVDLMTGVLPDDHRFQVHGSMAVTGLRTWHYVGFHPALPSLHVVVEWDDFTDQLLAGLLSLSAELEATREKLSLLWAAEFNR